MDEKELAWKIYSEIQYAFEGCYLADAGDMDIREKIEDVIKEYFNG